MQELTHIHSGDTLRNAEHGLPSGDPEHAARWAVENEGRLYDWQLILGFLAWAVPHKRSRVMCSEACAEMLGLDDARRFDPCALRAAVGAKP